MADKQYFLLKPLQWKVLLGTALAVFVMMFLVQSGITLPFPPSHKTASLPDPIWKQVKSRLTVHQQTFSIHPQRDVPILQTAYADVPSASAEAYLVINLSNGNILLSKNSTKQFPIASLTKIMSAVVALDLASPEATMRITGRAAQAIPTKIGVVKGQQMTLHELLAAMLLTSANDAAEEVRDGIDLTYKEPVFVRAMNQKAAFLGLTNTHFSNPQGFDSPQNYSTAGDLATLTRYALTKYPEIKQLVAEPYLFLPESDSHKQFDLYNWNGLLGVYPGVSGVKIGSTDKAKQTMVVVSKRNGVSLLAVILGAPDITTRDLVASNLLNTGFSDYNIEPFEVANAMLTQKYGTWRYWQ